MVLNEPANKSEMNLSVWLLGVDQVLQPFLIAVSLKMFESKNKYFFNCRPNLCYPWSILFIHRKEGVDIIESQSYRYRESQQLEIGIQVEFRTFM